MHRGSWRSALAYASRRARAGVQRNASAILVLIVILASVLAVALGDRRGESLKLDLKPFVDVVDPQRVELGVLTDYESSNTTEDRPEGQRPRFELRGYPVLSVEVVGSTPTRDIIFFYHWYDRQGVPLGVHDSYHMLRAAIDDSPAAEFVAPVDATPVTNEDTAQIREKRYIDLFAGIPPRRGADKTAFFVQDAGMRSGSKSAASKLTLYGQQLLRSAPDASEFNVSTVGLGTGASDVAYEISFAAAAGKEIADRGVRFHIPNVAAVYHVKANHDLQATTAAGEVLIGSMLPQVIAYKSNRGEFRTLYFAQADLIEFKFDPAHAALDIEVHAYDFRERSIRASTRFPDADLKRVHPNLGIVDTLPPAELTIMHTRSSILAFPLWQPNGYLASLAITEHADYVGVAQDMLTMYGGDVPVVTSGSGILGNKIPLTKTIFASGKNLNFVGRTASAETAGSFVQATLEDSPEFVAQLRRYKSDRRDVEIGAHCISGSLANAQRTTDDVERALTRLAEFKPVTWVDHGGAECLWESGWDPTSPFYIIPLLKKFGFKYLNALGDKYTGRLNMIADNGASNLLFQSIGLDDDLGDEWTPIVFNTTPIGFGKDDFTTKHIAEIIRARGLVNIHTYLPYESLMFETGADGVAKLKPNDWYNAILANLALANKDGDLFLATTERLYDFIWQVRGLKYYASGAAVHVQNPSDSVIRGLTFGFRDAASAAPATATIAGATIAGRRTSDGVNYVWFDLPADRAN